ncbi:uncharacterized protein LOC135121979 [Zophobas morio]|uniref:uncharacterized protein LOC135121979 n=1 Tax=Zophobas morio TaxID=2755281 RepID=UPI00308294F2
MEASSVDYRSDFSEDEGREKKILFSKRLVRSVNSRLPGISSLPPGAERVYEDPYQRHRKYIAQYLKFYKPEGDLHKHDKDVITERDIVKAENRHKVLIFFK